MKRRKFIQSISEAGLTPYFLRMLPLLQQGLLNSAITKAYAAEAGVAVKRYFKIQQFGAPSRWMFDLFLTPYSEGVPRELSPFIGTAFGGTSDRYTSLEYKTLKYKGINVPVMWGAKVQVSNGIKPISELLDHMICLQGIDAENDGHTPALELDYRPLGAPLSLTALSGDYGVKRTFSCITTTNARNSGRLYHSAKGQTSINVPGTTGLIQKVINPVEIDTSVSHSELVGSAERSINSVMDDFHTLAKKTYTENLTLANTYSEAADLMSQSFGDVGTLWIEKVNRYKNIVQQGMSSTVIPGINDRPIGKTGERGPEYRLASNIVTYADLRSMVGVNTTIHYLAERFAFAEFLFENDLTNCFEAGISNLIKLNTGAGNIVSMMNSDQHGTGSIISTYLTSLFHLAHSACLLEFIHKMKAKGMFDNILIEVSGEFNRKPRVDLMGSDHGSAAKSTTYFSGDFTGPLITGNLTSEKDPKYQGQWGKGAIIPELQASLKLRDQAATTTFLLGLDPLLLGSAKSILYRSGENIVSTLGKTRIV